MAMSVGTVVGYLDLDTSKFQSGLKTAANQLKGFTDNTKTTGDKFTSLGSGLKTLGQNMSTYVTLPLVGIGAAGTFTVGVGCGTATVGCVCIGSFFLKFGRLMFILGISTLGASGCNNQVAA